MAKVKISYDNIPKGQIVEVPHLGAFPNGATSTPEAFQVETWELHSGTSFPDELVLPAPAPETTDTDVQSEGERQRQIIERQESRTAEEAESEEKALTLAILRGEVAGDLTEATPKKSTVKAAAKIIAPEPTEGAK